MSAVSVDDALNFDASELAQEALQRKRERSQLLLDVTSQIVSNLQLRDFLRAISAIIRRVMQCNCASLSLPDTQNNQLQLYALDFSEGNPILLTSMAASSPARGSIFQQTEMSLCVNHNSRTVALLLTRQGHPDLRPE